MTGVIGHANVGCGDTIQSERPYVTVKALSVGARTILSGFHSACACVFYSSSTHETSSNKFLLSLKLASHMSVLHLELDEVLVMQLIVLQCRCTEYPLRMKRVLETRGGIII